VKVLVDNQLPAIAGFLASRGVDCQHVLDLALGEGSDAEIWEYANRNDCIVISKDEDFFLSGERSRCQGAFHLDSPRELPQQDALGRSGTVVAEDREGIEGWRRDCRDSLTGSGGRLMAPLPALISNQHQSSAVANRELMRFPSMSATTRRCSRSRTPPDAAAITSIF
jgi:hypothetical protein